MTPAGAPACSAALRHRQRRRIGGACLGQRMRRDDDGVARHQRQQDLEEDRADRIGRGRQREDDAGRRAAARRSSAPRSMRLRAEVLVACRLVDAAGADLVLDLLVLGDAEAGLLHRRLGQRARPARRPASAAALAMRIDRGAVEAREGGRRPAPPAAASCRRCRSGVSRPPAALRRWRSSSLSSCGVAGACRCPCTRRAPGRWSAPPAPAAPRRARAVISTPGLNCSTRGSRVEKIAQTPFS